MRKQYHFRESERGLLSWDVDRLVELTRDLRRKQHPLSEIRELDEEWFAFGERATWREMAVHINLVEQADLSYPIILSASGAEMDGFAPFDESAGPGARSRACGPVRARPRTRQRGPGPRRPAVLGPLPNAAMQLISHRALPQMTPV